MAGAVAASALAGCVEGARRPSPTTTPTAELRLAEQGYPPTVCEGGLVDVGIDAIVQPSFAPDWSGVDVGQPYTETGTLPPDATVIGVSRDARARAYPLVVLFEHEVVNDCLGEPLLVTYCSLCHSGTVTGRTVDGAAVTFGVSGQLWRPPELAVRAAEADDRTFGVKRGDPDPGSVRTAGNLVLFDRATRSYWSQLLARAICGPLRGTELSPMPATTATWADWCAAHPETEVLLPPPHSTVMDTPA